MDPIFFAIAIIPFAIPLLAKFVLRLEISWLEWAVQAALVFFLVWGIWALGRASVGGDVEVWNGAVTRKEAVTFRCPTNTMNPCKNGYDCNCYDVCTPTTDAKGNVTGQSCTTYCDTCYRYPWERDWKVHNTLRSPYEISRIDAQGANEPPRWTAVQVGEGVSITKPFKNWLGAASDSLFREAAPSAEGYAELLPDYPSKVIDYYRVDRVITPNVRLANEAQWNLELGKALGVVGPKKEVNAIYVFVDSDRAYAPALRYHWKGFKQNDAVVVIGVRAGTIEWAEVMSWSKNALFDVEMRNWLETYKGLPITALDPRTAANALVAYSMKSFERRPMEEFEYLKDDIPVPGWLIWTASILALLLSAGATYLFHRVDLDDEIFHQGRASAERRWQQQFRRY